MKKILVVLALLVVLSGLAMFPANDAPRPIDTQYPTATTGIYIIEEPVQTFMYRLDENREPIWSEQAVIPVGSLIKVSTCIDGYSQVEYETEDRWWRVEYVKCKN